MKDLPIVLALLVVFGGLFFLIHEDKKAGTQRLKEETELRRSSELALQDRILSDSAAIEAAVYLANSPIAFDVLAQKSLYEVCVYSVVPSGSFKHEPHLNSDYHECSEDQYTVTFPVTYDSNSHATLGTPTVKLGWFLEQGSK